MSDVFRVFIELLPVNAAVTVTAFGLVVLFFGFRLYRLWALLEGIALGALLAVFMATQYLPDYPLLHYFLGLLGAAIGGAIFFYVSVFLFGASMGIAVMHALNVLWLRSQGTLASTEIMTLMVSYVIAGITAGSLAVLFRRPFLIFITSAGGAAMALLGAALALLGPALAASDAEALKSIDNLVNWIAASVAFVALAITGAIVQWKTAAEPIQLFVDPAMGEKKPAAKKSKSKGSKGKSKANDEA